MITLFHYHHSLFTLARQLSTLFFFFTFSYYATFARVHCFCANVRIFVPDSESHFVLMSTVQLICLKPWHGLPPSASCTSQTQLATPCQRMSSVSFREVGDWQSAWHTSVFSQFQRPSTVRKKVPCMFANYLHLLSLKFSSCYTKR